MANYDLACRGCTRGPRRTSEHVEVVMGSDGVPQLDIVINCGSTNDRQELVGRIPPGQINMADFGYA